MSPTWRRASRGAVDLGVTCLENDSPDANTSGFDPGPKFEGVGSTISDDGQRIVFGTNTDLTGGNADLGVEVFALQADGMNLRQITSSPNTFGRGGPVISGNGSKIAYESDRKIYAVDWDGTGLGIRTHG